MANLIVVKVGGSLFDLPDLGDRLRRWLGHDPWVNDASVLLIPGGGPTTDVIRQLDQRHRIGEEGAHWLALRALSLNGHVLAQLLDLAVVVEPGPRISILDAHDFVRRDEERARRIVIPHVWEATSDVVAARAALVFSARRLVLLKSTSWPTLECGGSTPLWMGACPTSKAVSSHRTPKKPDWDEASRSGVVDPLFASMVRDGNLEVKVVNLREDLP